MTLLPPFERHQPASLEEAGELFDRYGDDAVAYAGGTELFLLFKFGFAEYPHVVDLKGIAELRGIAGENGSLRIGAVETHRAIERDPLVRNGWPALAAMERQVGNLRVRTMGSLGGNLCFADPHSDPSTFLQAMDAEVDARRGGGAARRIPLTKFVTGPYENALEPGELLTAVLVPRLAPGAAIAHHKFVLHERPAVTVAGRVRLAGGAVDNFALAVGSAGVVAARVPEAEELVTGRSPAEIDFGRVGELAADAANPIEDGNGSVEYKRHMVAVLAKRAIEDAFVGARASDG